MAHQIGLWCVIVVLCLALHALSLWEVFGFFGYKGTTLHKPLYSITTQFLNLLLLFLLCFFTFFHTKTMSSQVLNPLPVFSFLSLFYLLSFLLLDHYDSFFILSFLFLFVIFFLCMALCSWCLCWTWRVSELGDYVYVDTFCVLFI